MIKIHPHKHLQKILSAIFCLTFFISYSQSSSVKRSDKLNTEGWNILVDCESKKLPKEKVEESRKLFNKALRLNKDNYSAIEGLGRILCFSGQHEEAIKYFNRALSIEPNSSDCMIDRGNCKKDLGNAEDALDDYFSAKKINPESYVVDYNIALIYYDKGDYERSIKFSTQSLTNKNNYINAYMQRSKSYDKSGLYDMAIQDLKKVLMINPYYLEAFTDLGSIYLNTGDYPNSYSAYISGLNLSKDCGLCYFGRGYIRQDSGYYLPALADYRMFLHYYPDNSEIHNAVANILSFLNYPDSAYMYYNKAISLNTNNYSAYLNRGLLYQKQKKYAEAEADFLKSLACDSTQTGTYNAIGFNYHEQNLLGKAIIWYEKAIVASPTNQQAWLNASLAKRDSGLYTEALKDLKSLRALDTKGCSVFDAAGWVYYQKKDYKLALQYQDSSIKLCDTSSGTFSHRGFINWKLKRFSDAIQDFSTSIKMDSTESNYYNNRGMVYNEMKEYDKAMKDFLTCIRLKPDFLYPYNNLANAYFALKQKDKACEYWNKAIEKGYSYQPEWKADYGIDDPVELIKKHCR